jgi:hypothetical protein
MKKLALEIGELRVESFSTVAETRDGRGTVAAAEATAARCTARDCSCTCGGADPGRLADAVITCYCCA